ncbi:LytR/AlgR family response regulator transcription factor [Enterococcus sp. 5H]|uniref:LytR/AlgR family response regulator transcription factor n=1 Tax=Enterococcus sp. 5H TaxID=1229490 RepID=UPI002304C27A|nr:LytTR family DNA-binding domain-containing protein [Enterococcus sp. 5H]MDA9471079.1 Response regulator [Enterococcus sp. 5H]
MKIALCDDDTVEIGRIEQFLTLYYQQKYDFDFFSSETKLLKYIHKVDTRYSIYFISIEMAKNNGLHLAQKIREFDLAALIIFVSNSNFYMSEAFKVHAFDYLIRPLTKEKLLETMLRAQNYLNTANTYFDFSFNRKTIVLSMNEIIYIAKSGRIAYIHTREKAYKTYLTMSEILDKLDLNYFVKTHGSYVLNLNYVNEIIKNEVILKNVENTEQHDILAIPISRKFKDQLRSKYVKFLNKN